MTTNTKKQRLKILSRDWIFKNKILKKRRRRRRKKSQELLKINKYIYEVCFKNRVFFWKVIVGYKNEKGVIEDLKIVFKLKKDKKEWS